MFTVPAERRCERPTCGDADPNLDERRNWPSRAAGFWPWPAGARGFLVVVVLVAALGLSAASHSIRPGHGRAYLVAPKLVIDPNTAAPGVLGALPHVGPKLLNQLVEARKIHPFNSTADLRRRVRGLGPATLARLAPHLRIKPESEPTKNNQDPIRDPAPRLARLARGRQ
jgi:competence protein ComEA